VSTQAQSSPALAARGLSKSYGAQAALRGVDFSVESSELVAVIGPNGAGKTTLLSILAGISKPDGGEISLPRRGVGWVPQQPALYRRLTVEENLRLFARLEDSEDPEKTVREMLDLANLTDRAGDQVGNLSGGNQQRVNVALGLLSRPAVLLLDEPSEALDPRQRARLWGFITEMAESGTAVVFSTHDIQEAERHAKRVIVLADGVLLFDGTAAELRTTAAAAAPDAAHSDFERAFVAFLSEQGH
jgi:ABC-2 type transport system ATP-binding protein